MPKDKIFRVCRLTPIFILGIITIVLFSYVLFLDFYRGKIFPGVKIASIDTGGQTPNIVYEKLQSEFISRTTTPIKISSSDSDYTLNLPDSLPEINLESAVNEAYLTGRSDNYFKNLEDQIKALTYNIKITPKISFKRPSVLIYQINGINQVIKKAPKNATLALGETVIVTPSENGEEVDSKTLISGIENYLTFAGPIPKEIPLSSTSPKFTTLKAQVYAQALDNLKNAPLKLHYDKDTLTIDQVALLNILELGNQTQAKEVINPDINLGGKNIKEIQVKISTDKLANFLSAWTRKINQEAYNAKFNFDPNTKRVKEFQAAQEGREVDIEATAHLLAQAAALGKPSDIDLPVKVTRPTVNTEDVNNFGIKELLGRGHSNFAGSIENRIFNVGLASSRLNGALIAPGETFSFNRTVGEISGATGYKQAYIIKEGRTVLDDGGGVCQVSTTLFRAVLNAGLPVVARTAHAYRVGYYEQGYPPGLDATVFSPSVDFKFKNDTSSYILVQAAAYGTSLTIDIYGTSDGRVATLSKPIISSQTPPPAELRQDDPNLPRGTVKQVDWAAWGANVNFSRTVTRNGETLISENWKSNYRPWQAVYLVGTKD